MILLAAGIINRLLGFIPRIMLPRVIGAEGVGLYQLGYPFFLVLVTLISGGVPLAVAKLVSEAESEGRPERSLTVLRTSLILSAAAGILAMFFCLFGASWITKNILTDGRVYYSFISMSPMIVIVALSSVFRGYFQGKQNMIPSAASSIAETLARILCVLWFSYLLLPKGIAFAAAGAMLGVLAGELVGLATLLWQYWKQRAHKQQLDKPLPTTSKSKKPSRDYPPLTAARRMLRIAIPVTGGRLVGSLSYLLESITTAQSLAIAGVATAIATAQYGALQGMIIPLLLLPGALTSSLAVSLVPSLAEAQARGDQRTIHKRLHQSLRLALVTGAPFAVLMYVMAEPLCVLLYDNAEIAGMLKMMAPFALFMYIQAPLQATLQALDKPGRALVNTLIGAVIKIGLILYLASNPALGIYGAIIASIVNMLIVTLLHGQAVIRLIHFRFPTLDVIKVTCGMIIMAAITTFLYQRIHWFKFEWLQAIAASTTAVLAYLALMVGMGLIDRHDMTRVPIIGKWFK